MISTTQDEALPSFRIDTRPLPRSTAFSLWQEELVPYWGIRLPDNRQDQFTSVMESFVIGDVTLGTVHTRAQYMDRSRYRIARDGFTQYGLQFIIEGCNGVRDGNSDSVARNRGDLLVCDLTQPQSLEASDLSVLYFTTSRDALAPLLTQPDHHNQRVLPGTDPLVALLREHLLSVHKHMPQLGAADARALMKPTLELTAAVLNGRVTKPESNAVAYALTQHVRSFVEHHITEGLSAESVALRFGMSRRKLYYLFEPFGGFSSYVLKRRLYHTHRALADPSNRTKSIVDIAEAFGFNSYPAFGRAFRRQFAISPREVRAMIAQGHAPHPTRTSDNAWYDWFLRTR